MLRRAAREQHAGGEAGGFGQRAADVGDALGFPANNITQVKVVVDPATAEAA